MRVVAVKSGTVEDFVLAEMSRYTDIDLLIFGYGVLPQVDFAEEVKRENGVFFDLSLLSKDLKCVVIAACETLLYGTVRKSALVFENGRVLGVSDQNNTPADGEYLPGFGFRVYDTAKGGLGLVVDGDVMFPESFSTISRACGDYAVTLLSGNDSDAADTMLGAAALANGLSILCLSEESLSEFRVTGKLAMRVKEDVGTIDFVPQCVYNEILCKCRGLIR